MIEEIVLVGITGFLMLLSFKTGASLSQKRETGEKIEIKTPVRAVKDAFEEHKENKKLAELEKINEINEWNIEHYDGTGIGQRDFPR